MTEGELLLLHTKAAREERGISAVIRQAVAEYQPMTPEPEHCMQCDEDENGIEREPELMVPIWHDDERTLDVNGVKHTITITGIPAQKCPRCGDVTFSLDLMCEIEKAELRMVNHFMRYNKEWPEKISIEELSRLMDK
ncbi:hypothetical protein CEB3_c13520 [Peptococcaceae bacterium CEB3]|nr:hypothetical protein CEB3_c13520 [Peptococcaceae bacterium CEB3]